MDVGIKGRKVLGPVRTWTAWAVLVAMGGAAWAQTGSTPEIVEVKAGDTFSAIAGRFTGRAAKWRSMYRPAQSNLQNPNLLQVGQRLELVSDAKGRYLRLLDDSASGFAAAPSIRSPTDSATPAAPGRGTDGGAATATAPATTPAATPAAPALAPLPAPAATASAELVIGVLPNIAPATLLAQYERLQRFLERSGAQRVKVVVPANFKVFFDSTMRGDYDLAVAAPHFARLAQVDRKFVPVGMYEPRINALLVAPIDSSVQSSKDLRERTIGFANPQSLVAMYGVQWLRQQGLEQGRDYEVKPARTDLGVGRMMLTGETVAAVMSNGEFRALPGDESVRLKVVDVFARIPNFVVVAHPRLGNERIGQLRSQLKAFFADREEGEPFTKATGFAGIVDADDAQLRELDAFSPQTRRAMGFTP